MAAKWRRRGIWEMCAHRNISGEVGRTCSKYPLDIGANVGILMETESDRNLIAAEPDARYGVNERAWFTQ